MPDKGYLNKVLREKEIVLKTAFWKEHERQVRKWRENAGQRCETDEDVRSYQGEVRAYKNVLGLSDKIIRDLEKRADAK